MNYLNLNKSYEFFKPEDCTSRIHIIGCGSVGSTVAELLVRFGLRKITLYDFDVVESHNIANQLFRQEHIGMPKIEALVNMMCEINPELKNTVTVVPSGYNEHTLAGYVFLCVDNIELRHKIALSHRMNPNIKAMFDFRTRLVDAQHYAADWTKPKMVTDFINSMNFSHEEAKRETPTSACGTELSVAPTVRMVSACGVANFINFINNNSLKKMILVDAFNFVVDSF